jgi:hypothetical protein
MSGIASPRNTRTYPDYSARKSAKIRRLIFDEQSSVIRLPEAAGEVTRQLNAWKGPHAAKGLRTNACGAIPRRDLLSGHSGRSQMLAATTPEG